MQILLSFTHPYVVLNLHDFLSSLEHKPVQTVDVQNGLVTNVIQNIIFYVSHKKDNHTGLEQHEGEWMIESFLNYSFNLGSVLIDESVSSRLT